jgi:predicted Co/Zn/Cd cation transporter (cation efflux family)
MNQALAVIVGYIVHENQGYSYPGLLIYGMALYAFYAMITAVINVVKFRKLDSPVLFAAMIVNLTAAMVSMLSLETAMLSEFGSEDDRLRLWMTGISGGVVCTFVLGMAIYMIVRSTKYLKKQPI